MEFLDLSVSINFQNVVCSLLIEAISSSEKTAAKAFS